MTSRERLSRVLHGEIPDHVPVSPDISNMIPAKLTGKPFWQLYLYNYPPIYMAYIDAVKKLGFDSLMDGYVPIEFEGLDKKNDFEEVIVCEKEDRIITQKYNRSKSSIHKKVWQKHVTVYFSDNPPCADIVPESIGLSENPKSYKAINGRKETLSGGELLSYVKKQMGEYGVVGVFSGTSLLLHNQQEIYDYYDNHEKYIKLRDKLIEKYTHKFYKLIELPNPAGFHLYRRQRYFSVSDTGNIQTAWFTYCETYYCALQKA